MFIINNRDIKNVVFGEIGNDFTYANEMITYFNNHLQNKYDFVI